MIDPSLYNLIYFNSLFVFTLFYAFTCLNFQTEFINVEDNYKGIYVYILLMLFFLGLRPLSGVFVDTMNYALKYQLFQTGDKVYNSDSKEWLFEWLMFHCSKYFNVQIFFLIVEFIYFIPVLWACYKFVPNHYILMFIFCMGAFSFLSYGVNGIRNGMACSLVIAALPCVNSSFIWKIVSIILCWAAFYIHKSTALPISCIFVACLIKDSRYTMIFWLISIIVSLLWGGPIEQFFVNLGFDDRMESYASTNLETVSMSSSSFRWDFLLYSSIPILMGYYVLYVRKVWDKNYLLLLNTYILSNAFWVMMIRAAFSNRFAYLSWFLYALVLSYPCLRLPIWRKQGLMVAFILVCHFLFTYLMFQVVYN